MGLFDFGSKKPAAAKPQNKPVQKSMAPSSGVKRVTEATAELVSEGVEGKGYESRMIDGVKLVYSPKIISTESELVDAISFNRTLVEAIGLSANLYPHLSPLETARDSKKVVLLVSAKYARSDDLREILRALSRKGFSMLEGGQPNIFVSQTESIVLAVSRSQISGEEAAVKRKYLNSEGGEGALWKTFVEIISWGAANNASDVHINIVTLAERSQVRFTIEGKYLAPEQFQLPTTTLNHVAGVAYLLSKGGNGSQFAPNQEQQCRIFMELNNGRKVMLRWASMATDDGPQITLRILKLDESQDAITLDALGYLPSQVAMFERAMTSEGGAIVMAGVVGSGKSTTLASLMRAIPQTRKIMTLEDPREYIIPGAHQNTVSRSMDSNDDTVFLPKLRTLKRTAFNDLLIGEIRDQQTGTAFQDVVESGHNVYTTVHARRHIGIPDRLASPFIGVAREVLATPGILKLLVYQALLPKNCEGCALSVGDFIEAQPDDQRDYWMKYFDRIVVLFEISLQRVTMRNHLGCKLCKKPGLPNLWGLKGRTVVAEMVEPDENFLTYVRDAANIELENYAASLRMTALDDPNMLGKSALEAAIYKMQIGLVDPREIEPRFESFETIEIRRNMQRQSKEARLKVVAAGGT